VPLDLLTVERKVRRIFSDPYNADRDLRVGNVDVMHLLRKAIENERGEG